MGTWGFFLGLIIGIAMKTIKASETVEIPPKVTINVKARNVTVKGPRGTLRKNFKHAMVDIRMISAKKLVVEKWFGTKKELAGVRTCCSHIENMIKGVTRGFVYKMKSVYAHFPINIVFDKNIPDKVEIRNFLGERYVRTVFMPKGVTCQPSGTKDEITLTSNDIELVSRSAARIQQSTTVKRKDIRKFLDCIYVSEKTFAQEADE